MASPKHEHCDIPNTFAISVTFASYLVKSNSTNNTLLLQENSDENGP